MSLIDAVPVISGASWLWIVQDNGIIVPRSFTKNQIQYAWGYAAVQTLCRRQPSYGISSLYIEFENVADPADPVDIPTFDRSEGVEYYADLAGSSTRDYLRVPLLQDPLVGIQTGFEPYFTPGTNGNKAMFFGMSTGVVGVHGKTFSDTANSKVFGVALVATPVIADLTQDIVVARTYYPVDEQTPKLASSQVGVSWELYFG